ncbi:TetR family transcriptional regulator [Pseudomonas sp. D5002]|uniref:TetR family transcriptional regulator n=1 Tax=Pseudomonas sp. D5002 TaxID=2738818 RepID=UPI0015A3624E|nr:TetR family transcriptional regulator [Pseudomonas sp. D5002]NWB11915.1 TetR family transcriptional regulator [Pseudomonas sp. D5002]
MSAVASLEASLPIASCSPREHIRSIALKMFVESDFHSLSLRQLASVLGMQAGSLYTHREQGRAAVRADQGL